MNDKTPGAEASGVLSALRKRGTLCLCRASLERITE